MEYIIRESASEIRTLARFSLRKHWSQIALAMAVYYLLISTLPLAIDELLPGAVITQYNTLMEQYVEYPVVSTLYSALLQGPFQLGLSFFFISFVRRRDIKVTNLFSGFEHIFKAIWLTVLIFFYVFLWTLLFIIPGFVAAFRYSQAYFVLADHPEYSAGQCIRESKKYMSYNKGRLFWLNCTYFGWMLLSLIVPAVLAAFMPDWNGILYLTADFVFSIPYFFVLAYVNTGMTVFYELVSKHLVAAPAPTPMAPPMDDSPQNPYEF